MTLFEPPAVMRVPPGEHARAALPQARLADPQTSHTARVVVSRGARELEAHIATCVREWGPISAFGIAKQLAGGRWSDATVRSAVSRCERDGRIAVVGEGMSPRRRPCALYGVNV